MDLRRLGLFLAVVDHGGFSAAARAVHVAQPAISLAVRELESELGTALLVRSRQGVALTAAGEALIGPARQAQRDIATARAAVAAVTGLAGGHVDLVSLPSLAADPVAELIGRFRRAHPPVHVRLAAPDDPSDLLDMVTSGRAEVGITERHVNGGLVQVDLVAQDLVVVSPPGTRFGPGPVRHAELAGLPLLATARGTSLRALLEHCLAEAGVDPTVAVETEQRDALVPLVLAGAGTAVLPAPLAEAGRAAGAVVRPLDPPLHRHVVLVHRPGPLSPAAARFVALASTEP
jgi:DNA-binding transcriptional LysR family regulator